MKKIIALCILTFWSMFIFSCSQNAKEKQLNNFISVHLEKIEPLSKEANLAYWDAATTGNEKNYQKFSELELKIRQIYSDTADFSFLTQLKESNEIQEKVLARQLSVLHNAYLENQVEQDLLKQIVDLGAKLEQKFSTFRGSINNKKVTSNEIEEILKNETDSRKRKNAWLASKQVGNLVADEIIQLVKLRNKAAKNLGFDNYHTLSLTTSEQDVKELDKIFNQLYELTNEPFAQLKQELDEILADNYGIGVAGLMPWHYHDPFFQETPLVYELDLDTFYQDKDVKVLAASFFKGIGLPVEDILENSDLYERDGKNPHAFCTDIDKKGDVRILCNLHNNERWMETTLHELGHAVYDKFHDPKMPFLLREPAHVFTTEAIAMFFGRLSRNAAWMQTMLNLTSEQRAEIEKVSTKYAQLKQLIFARWAMVMYNFEKQLYANPDQDLNALWWELVKKYQLVDKPARRTEPDWAAKIHFVIAPCYYHNYLLGELLGSQLHHHLVHQVMKQDSDQDVSYINQRQVGDFFRKNVFEVGALYSWNDMITRATGEPLNPKYFVDQFIL